MASDGTGADETIIDEGILEVYVWNLTDLQASEKEGFRYIQPVSIPTVPGMKLNDTTKLTELLNNTVQVMDVLINKSVPVSSLINKEMKLNDVLNGSITVGEVVNTTHISEIVKSEHDTTIKQLMEMSETIRTVLNEAATLVDLLDTTMSIKHVTDSSLPIKAVMNTSLSVQIPFNDTIVFSEFLDTEPKFASFVNDSLFVKDSLNYFEIFNESLQLEDIFESDSILIEYRRIFKFLKTVNESIVVLENSVNDVIKRVNDYNSSLLYSENNSNNTAQQLVYLSHVEKSLDTIKNVLQQMEESVSRLDNDNITGTELTNETLEVNKLSYTQYDVSSNISGLLEEIGALNAENVGQSDFLALNISFLVSYELSEAVKTEVENMYFEVIKFHELVNSENTDWDNGKTVLEQIGSKVNLGQLVNTSVYLKDVLIDSATLRDLELADNEVWTYLEEDMRISDLMNDHSYSVYLVDVLEKSNATKNRALKTNHLWATTNALDNHLFRGFVSYFLHLIFISWCILLT